jgi:hypothetical protein
MRVRVKVGDVEVTVEGVDYTRRQVRGLLGAVAGVAVMLTPDEPERAPVGFSVVTERADDPEPEAFFTDDEE